MLLLIANTVLVIGCASDVGTRVESETPVDDEVVPDEVDDVEDLRSVPVTAEPIPTRQPLENAQPIPARQSLENIGRFFREIVDGVGRGAYTVGRSLSGTFTAAASAEAVYTATGIAMVVLLALFMNRELI